MTARKDEFVFESFELLASNDITTSCAGRLVRHFPGPAAVVDRDIVIADNFLPELAHILSRFDIEVAPTTRPTTRKGGKKLAEARDTISPILVTSMLVGLLRGIGRDANSVHICKHSREQVNWDVVRLPWHRSAAWLALRVGLRLVLDRAANTDTADDEAHPSLYKQFIAWFLGSVLRKASAHSELSSDLLYSMSAKIVRRVQKLDPPAVRPWLSKLLEIIEQNSKLLELRWKDVQQRYATKSRLDFGSLGGLNFTSDAVLSLANLNQFFAWIDTRVSRFGDDAGAGDNTTFLREDCDELPDMNAIDLDSDIIPFKLIDVEAWVALHLDRWIANRDSVSWPVENDLCKLRDLLEGYYAVASSEYRGNPDSLSYMYLTVMHLWVALDMRACKAEPLLLEYNTGFPRDMLHRLLLPKKSQMARLDEIERYLAQRTRQGRELPFERFGEKSSFAVRYFDQSSRHQNLKDEITAYSESQRGEKLRELVRQKLKYAELSRKIANGFHDTEFNTRTGRYNCNRYCSCCLWVSTRKAMSISVFEWPLPSDDSEAKAAVFEIAVPQAIAIWRHVTIKCLSSIFRSNALPTGSGPVLYYISRFHGLHGFISRSTRVQPASSVKPFTVSHYSSQPVGEATESSICVPHGCRYEYFDEDHDRPILESVADPKTPGTCSFANAVGSPLKRWVESTAHTSNDVIAGQFECPPWMRLDAFRAFGHLRSGVRIQWLNILCQLMVPSLDFDSEAACLLIMEATCEAGPPDRSIFRSAHDVTQLDHFVEAARDAITSALDRIEESWEHSTALACLVVTCIRLLSLSSARKPLGQLCTVASRLRKVAHRWTKKLLEKLGSCATAVEEEEWSQRVLFSSLTCIATFDVDREIMVAILRSEAEAALLLEASIQAREHLPASGRPSRILDLVLFQRWQRIAYRSQTILVNEIKPADNRCLDLAIKQVWPDSPESNEWVAGVNSQSHILSTSVDRRDGMAPMRVTYNLLTGSLLVNGNPLRKLPARFREKEAYKLLFGSQNLDVMPSTAQGMQFSSSTLHEGFVVHFAMIEKRLVIRAVRDDCTLEFIPPSHLEEDFPASFVSEFSHWLHLDTMEVEFRPIGRPWISSSNNWTMRFRDGRYILTRENYTLIDPRSTTAATISAILLPIETSTHLHLILEPEGQRLEIDLPRIGLSFFLRLGQSAIESKQYGAMYIDEDQEVGSLIGLRNKLVLRPEADSRPSRFRRIVVPPGTISYKRSGQHTEVAILISSGLHHVYLVDDKLGRLVDSGTLRTKLLLAYLHALTSHCLPDPLTGRTGTEEAMRILKSAAVVSFQKLDDGCSRLLVQIAAVSPMRHYYPSHLTCMEQTKWSGGLPPLSQHESFGGAVRAIRAHAADCKLFEGLMSASLNQTGNESEDALVLRALIRNSTFRVSGFGAEEHSARHDREYRGRTEVDKMKTVYRSTVFLDHGSPNLLTKPTWRLKNEVLSLVGSEIEGPSVVTNEPPLELRFDIQYLKDPAAILPNFWCRFDEALASVDTARDKYKLMFFFAGMIFAQESKWDVVQLLLARAAIQSVRSVSLPGEQRFNRAHGSVPTRHQLKTEVQKGARPFRDCPEHSLPNLLGESRHETQERRYAIWKGASNTYVDSLVNDIMRQWPCRSVSIPQHIDYQQYVQVDKVKHSTSGLFLETWRNRVFDSYLDQLTFQMSQLRVIPVDLPARSEQQLTAAQSPRGRQHPPRPGFVAISSLFARPAPQTSQPRPTDFSVHYEWVQETTGSEQLSRLLGKLELLADTHAPGSQQGTTYIEDLRKSFRAYLASDRRAGSKPRLLKNADDRRAALLDHWKFCRERVDTMRRIIDGSLRAKSVAEQATQLGRTWPRISPVLLLQRLTRHHWEGLSREWRLCITNYALAMTYFQQAGRLLDSSSQPTDLFRELTNSVHTWDPLMYPESLLLEVEQGLLIRKVQDDVAASMRDPPDNLSSVVQLNMGEGKSSVIVPIIAAVLADGARLVRVVVGKPQSKQMAHTLVSKLGGLLDRRVFFLPFSRSIRLETPHIDQIRRMIRTCRDEGGVLLVQPEHLLSFQLMGLECRHSNDPSVMARGQEMLNIHDECGRIARDIVDESDENFSVKFELVYTMGSQQPVDYSPDRWMIIQEVLQRIRVVAKRNTEDYGTGLEIQENESGGFPVIRILEASAGTRLLHAVASDICDRGLRGFPIQHQPRGVRAAVLKYICCPQIGDDDRERIFGEETGFSSGSAAGKALLLLRGLFAKGIIEFALRQKRFRVNYGLAPDRQPRTMLAVPYRAKDSPAPRSEFSHPDVVIVLTCLSYYYGGLSDREQLLCFEHLSRSDQAAQEYDSWTREAPKLDDSLRYYSAVNVRDRGQCAQAVFPALRHARPAIDFYLSRVVFPKEMREFPRKLSASGWDLAKRKTHPVTGFSGTNDSRYVLPLPIRPLDLPEQQHTNAAVLDCLLGDENRVMALSRDVSAEHHPTATALLEAVVSCVPKVQVILDVGAQVIELDNRQMAEAWLRVAPEEMEAVIFFDDRDDLLVLTRKGAVDKFLTSSFFDRTESCLVFLDQAHTRGTDLRLPDYFRAAVTLGPKITKDTLVQGKIRHRPSLSTPSVTELRC